MEKQEAQEMGRTEQYRAWIERMPLSDAQKSLALNCLDDLQEIERLASGAGANGANDHSPLLAGALARAVIGQTQILLELYARPAALERAVVAGLIEAHRVECAAGRAGAGGDALPWKAWVQAQGVRLAWPTAFVVAALAVARPEVLTPILQSLLGG
jgi:hypothetical protein